MNLEEKIKKAEEYKRYFIGKITVFEIAMNFQKENKIELKKLITAVEQLNLKERKLFDKKLENLSEEQLHKKLEEYLKSITNEMQKLALEDIGSLKVFMKDYEQEIKSTFY